MSIVTTNYGQKQLALLKADQIQSSLWETHPVRLSEIEMKTFNLHHIVSILAGESQPPSKIAGIQSEKIASPLIRRLDEVYHKAIESYKETLEAGTRQDRETIESNKNFWIYENCPGYAWLIKILGASFISQDQYERDARAYRYAWCIEVSALEKQRLSAMRIQIEAALAPLIEDLEDLEKHNQIDVDLLKQAVQLRDVYHAHFPNMPLNQVEDLIRKIPAELTFLSMGNI